MTALVTGATSGIGAAFVVRLAADGHDIVAVARTERTLLDQASTIRHDHGISVETLVADLSTREGQAAVVRRLSDPSPAERPVDVLVNCAGSATAPDFADTEPDDLRALLELNVASVQELTRAALPAMLARGRGAVVNVSSMNAYLTMPGGAAVYGASKSYVLELTKGVALTLPPGGVRVMALCPGPTRTAFHAASGTPSGTAPAWMMRTPEWVVDRALDDLRRGRIVSVPGAEVKAVAALGHALPVGAMARVVRAARARRLRGAA